MAARRPFVERALGIRSEDREPLAWLGGANFLVNVGGELAWGALMGRFVAEAGAKAMPAMYMAVSAGSAALFLGLAFLAGPGSTRRLVGWILAASVAFVAIAAGPVAGAPGTAFASLLAAWIYQLVYEPELLGWAAGQVPLQGSKRITPAVAAAGALGRVAGALLATDPLHLGSIRALLLLAAVLNAGTVGVIAAFAGRGGRPKRDSTAAPARPGFMAVLGQMHAEPLFLRLGAIALLVGLVTGMTDYPRTVLAAKAFPTPEKLAAFYGAVGALTNAATVVLQLFGTGVLVRRLGLEATLGVLPLVLGALAGVACLRPGFLLAAGIRALHLVLTRSTHGPAALMLLNAAPQELGPGIRAVAYGGATSLGLLGAGVALALAGQPRLEAVYAAMGAACGLAWLASRGVGGAYRHALAGELHRQAGAADGADRREELEEFKSLEARVLFASGDPRLIEVARQAARVAGAGPMGRALGTVLARAPEEVALAALERAARAWIPGEVTLGLGNRLLGSADPGVRLRAIGLVAELGDGGHAPALLARLGAAGLEPDEPARLGGAVLKVAGRPEELRAGVAALKRELEDADPRRRRAGLEVLGRLGFPVFAGDLAAGLEDPDPAVAVEAARALGRARIATAVPALEACIAAGRDPALVAEARAARARITDQAMDRVLGLLEVLPERDRRRLSRTIAGLDPGTDGELLERALGLEPAALRAAAVAALKGAAAEGRLEAMRAALGAPGGLDGAALVAVMLARPGADDGPLERVLAAMPREAGFAALEAAGTGVARGAPDRGTLARLVHLAGIVAGSVREFEEAFHLICAGGDKALVSKALELVEAGLPAGEFRRALLAALPR